MSTVKIPAIEYYYLVMMIRPFYKKQEKWSCDDIIQLLKKIYKDTNISQETWFSQQAVNCLIKGCYNWDTTESMNYFARHYKELNPFKGEKGEYDNGWSSNRCEQSGSFRFMISIWSEYAIKIFAQFLYPLFNENFSKDMVLPALNSLGIDITRNGAKEAENWIYSELQNAYKILSNPEAHINAVQRKQKEKREKEEQQYRLRKKRSIKIWTMLLFALLFYILSCIMCDINGKEGAILRSFIWFFWAFIEIIILAGWDTNSESDKLIKMYSIFSFLSVPIIAFFFVFFLRAYSDNDFLHLTMILFAPLSYLLTWLVFIMHKFALNYTKGPNKN